MGDAAAAGVCMALAWLLWQVANETADSRLRTLGPADGWSGAPPGDRLCSRPSIGLVLELITVAVRQGASIPRAMEAVGEIVRGDVGEGLMAAARALGRGACWGDAWAAANGAIANHAASEALRPLSAALATSWEHGASPVVAIETIIEHMDVQERSDMRRFAAGLSVKILLPMGLCFLPAFIAIGVIPTIASFVG